MQSLSNSGPEEPPPGQSYSANGDVRSRKRKRAGTPTIIQSDVDPASTLFKERMSLLSKLPQPRPVVDSLKSPWNDILEVLDKARPHDIPFALLYSVRDRECDSIGLNMSPNDQLTPERLVLEGLVGMGDKNLDVSLFQLMLAENFKEPHLTELRLLQTDQSPAFRNGMQLIAQDSKHPADNILLCPIFAHDTAIKAFLLLGVNSERCDDDFRMFAQILSDSVSKYVSTYLLRRKLQDVQSASEVLLRRVEEAERSNFMFRHMAESATVGCAIFDPTGHPMWLNEAYINLTGVSREDFRPGIWQKAIVPEDLPKVEGCWNKLASGEPIVPFTFRVKRHHSVTEKAGACESLDHRWLLSNAYVDLNEDGSCRRIMGWLTDISAQKWNEHLQAQRLADALETKRQTERFIDMVSHEIRNPLSAIIQTADGVLTLIDHQKQDTIPLEICENFVDAGKTIILCAHHQKRIVDDILTLSKLDSNLLVISPNHVQPRKLVQKAIKMFKADLSSAQIEASISIDASYNRHSVNTVLLDERRVLQILLNLINNAIKFTRNCKERYVRIRLAASPSRPSIETSEISYISPRVSHPSISADASTDEEIYLIFAVEDTGPGLSRDDMKSLFQRFSQASPKTYRGYGGFGLGLFICRELAELQGGQIGLSSVLGLGTTFTFYVQAQRCTSDAVNHAANSNIKSTEALKQTGDGSPDGKLSALSATPSTASTTLSPINNSLMPDFDVQKLHILVVEDNKINQNVLVRQLRLLGCTVYTADHGLEALELLGRSNFNISPTRDNGALTPPIRLSVILMDIEMPIMDGLTCVRRIRQMEAEGNVTHVPVIAVTANARSDQISGAMVAGMDGVVTKPFRIPELIPKIAAAIKGPENKL